MDRTSKDVDLSFQILASVFGGAPRQGVGELSKVPFEQQQARLHEILDRVITNGGPATQSDREFLSEAGFRSDRAPFYAEVGGNVSIAKQGGPVTEGVKIGTGYSTDSGLFSKDEAYVRAGNAN